MRRLTSQDGMNYIQMLLVLVSAGILGALVVPYLTTLERDELIARSRERVERIADAQLVYYRTHGVFTMEIDSLMMVEPDPEVYIDPLTESGFEIGVVNQGQDFSISSTAEETNILITEDRWNELQQARIAWNEYQNEIRRQSSGGR